MHPLCEQHTLMLGSPAALHQKRLFTDSNRNIFTTAKVDGSYQLQVRVDPPDAVDVPAVLQAWAHRGLVQVFGFASLPKTKHSTCSKSRTNHGGMKELGEVLFPLSIHLFLL